MMGGDLNTEKTQADKFKEAARALECDDDPERFRERVGKLVKHKPREKEAD
jgi:hypothetical protein